MITWLVNKLIRSDAFNKFIIKKIVDAMHEFIKTETMNNIISNVVIETLKGDATFYHNFSGPTNPLLDKISNHIMNDVKRMAMESVDTEEFIDNIVERIKKKQLS